MSDCCCPPKPSPTGSVALCAECGAKGRSVERRTVLHHVRSELLARVSDDDYRVCPTPACAVVYYNTCGDVFTVNDVRELVTAKASGDARPLCYCFGFTEGDIRKELTQTGKTKIPAQISRFIKEKICACEIRNPAGACCLGDVNKTAQQLVAKGEIENA
jgi:Zinc binding domain